MVTSLQTELNPSHQTSAEDVDDDMDGGQVVKAALHGGFVYTSWFLSFSLFWMFLSSGFIFLSLLLTAVFLLDRR